MSEIDQYDLLRSLQLFGKTGKSAAYILPALSDSTTTMGSPLATCVHVGVSQQGSTVSQGGNCDTSCCRPISC